LRTNGSGGPPDGPFEAGGVAGVILASSDMIL
jgi:hypothetical protein